jgi:hypothetical protein
VSSLCISWAAPVVGQVGSRPFDPAACSRYKYGFIAATDAFARASMPDSVRQAVLADRQPKPYRAVWILPFAFSVDNITLVVGIGSTYAIPALRRRMALTNGVCGVALLVACGVLLMVG